MSSICPGTHQESPSHQMNKSPNNQVPINQSSGILTVYTTVKISNSGTPTNVNVINSAWLLKTTTSPTRSPNFTTEASILFDERAQRFFVTGKVASQLRLNSIRKETISFLAFGAFTQAAQQLDACSHS